MWLLVARGHTRGVWLLLYQHLLFIYFWANVFQDWQKVLFSHFYLFLQLECSNCSIFWKSICFDMWLIWEVQRGDISYFYLKYPVRFLNRDLFLCFWWQISQLKCQMLLHYQYVLVIGGEYWQSELEIKLLSPQLYAPLFLSPPDDEP